MGSNARPSNHQVLPPGELNSMIPEPLPVCSESYVITVCER